MLKVWGDLKGFNQSRFKKKVDATLITKRFQSTQTLEAVTLLGSIHQLTESRFMNQVRATNEG